MKHERIQKAESISQKLIWEFLIQELQELTWDFWIITITSVKLSSELSYLDVYVSSLKNHEVLCKKLAEYAHQIQRELGRKIDFIKVPKIRFRYDETGETSFHIYQKIQELDIK